MNSMSVARTNSLGARPTATVDASKLQDGFLRTEFDQSDNIVRVYGQGMWSLPYARAHFAELDLMLRRARMSGAPAHVLVDLREAGIQTPETALFIAEATTRIYKPGDRIAIIVASSLLKFQMRRTVDPTIHEIFISPHAAKTWLCAWF